MKYLVEFIGTFLLLTIIGFFKNPLIIGIGLSLLIYLGAKFSGAHYNPAVSISFYFKKTISLRTCIKYIFFQISGAISSATILSIIGKNLIINPSAEESIFLIIASEFFFTFLMTFVILLVAIYPKTKGNNYYGIAIGLTVSLGIYLVGNISGSVFNPSVFIGPSFIDYLNGGNTINNIYLYVLSTVSGSLFAVLIYNTFLEKS